MSQQNAVRMTVNWTRDVELEDGKISKRIRISRTAAKMMKDWKDETFFDDNIQ